MKIGKDEIGPAGIIGLILQAPSFFLVVYGLFYGLLLSVLGMGIWIIALVIYYDDLYAHRQKKQLPPPPPQ